MLALKLEGLFREKAKENQRESGGAVPQKSAKPPIETRCELAKIAGVSHDTIAKVKVIDKKATTEQKGKLKTGEISINQAYVEIKKEERNLQKEKEVGREARDIQLNGVLPIIGKTPIAEKSKETHSTQKILAKDLDWSTGNAK